MGCIDKIDDGETRHVSPSFFILFYVFPSVNPARRATEIYKKNGYDIALVQRLLQHSSATVITGNKQEGLHPQLSNAVACAVMARLTLISVIIL